MLNESAVTSRFYWLICYKISLIDNSYHYGGSDGTRTRDLSRDRRSL